MQFKEITGQQETAAKLVQGVTRGRISHAQLFIGGEGVGALPLAIAYAQYLNCTDRRDGDSCGQCPSCRQIAQLAHPDVHFVFPVNTPKGKSSGEKPLSDAFLSQWRRLFEKTGGYFSEPMWYSAIEIDNKQGNISTFEADEIIRKLSFKAFESEYKAVIIWLPERMNTQAANKLLKIIEEPWEKTLFLMVSESPERLLPTILSRMQVVAVPAIADERMAAWLAAPKGVPMLLVIVFVVALYKLQIVDGKAYYEENRNSVASSQTVAAARGSILEASRVLEQRESSDEYFELFVRLMRLSYEDRHMELLEWAETVAALGREEQKQLLENAIRLLRDSYMLTAGVERIAYLFGREYEFCRKFAPYVNNGNIEQLIAEMELAIRQVAQNGNPRILFPHFALTISKLIRKI